MAGMSAGASLNWVQIRTLLKLRGRLTLRQFTRERGRILGAIIVLLVFGPMIIAAAVGSAIGYLRLELAWSSLILGGVLVGLWLVWLAFPILFSSINEGLDITRLLVYPVATRDVIVATLISPIFDYPTYLVLPLFIAVLVGFGVSAALPVVIVGLLLAFAHMVLIGQLVITAVGGLLQSRRFRDVSIIVASLLGSSCYFINIGVQRLTESMSASIAPEDILNLNILGYLQWLPTGAVAQAITQALSGQWGGALLWLGYTAVLLVIVAAVWFRLMVRLTTGQGFLISARPREEKETAVASPRAGRLGTGGVLALLPADIAELVLKELRSIWRIPQRRVGLAQGIIFPLIMFGSIALSTDGGSFAVPEWGGLVMPLYALFLFWVMTQNMLAWEGRGLATLLLTPVPRQRIFLAKGLALLLTSGGMFAMIALVTVFLQPGWLSVVGLLTGLGMGMAAMAVTAVASVIFPMPINLESKRMRSNFQQRGGCIASLGVTFLVPLGLGIVSLPGGLPLLAAWYFELPWLGVLGVVFTFAYGGAAFWFGTRLAGTLLLGREAQVIEALRLPEEDGD